MKTLIKYDGKYEGFPGESRSWTLISHFIDSNGCDRFRGSFGLQSLVDFGIVPATFAPPKIQMLQKAA